MDGMDTLVCVRPFIKFFANEMHYCHNTLIVNIDMNK